MKMSMDGKGREKTKKASEEEDPHLHEGDDGEKRNAEESLDESSTETRIEVKEKTGSWKNKDLRLRWIVLMRKMLKDLEMEASDEDPKLEMMNLEDHLGQVKKKAAIWQSRARERITVMDTGSEIQEEEERRKSKRKNKRNNQRPNYQNITEVVTNMTIDDSNGKKEKFRNFPLQSSNKVPSASKFTIMRRNKN